MDYRDFSAVKFIVTWDMAEPSSYSMSLRRGLFAGRREFLSTASGR